MNSCSQGEQEKKTLGIYQDIVECLRQSAVGKDIVDRFKDSLKRLGNCPLSRSRLNGIIDDMIASGVNNTLTIRQPLLSCFPAPFNKLKKLEVSGEEYLMANQDVLNAWKYGAITSWIDHLLSSGIVEFIEGKRNFYLNDLAVHDNEENDSQILIAIVACDGTAACEATTDAIAEATGCCKQEIIIYDTSKGVTTCLGNGNITGDLSELALLAGLANRPILLVRNGCKPAKSLAPYLYQLRERMDRRLAIYGDCIVEETVSNKKFILRGKPFSGVSLFETDITSGIVALTPLSLIDLDIKCANHLHTAWQELITSCYLNGVAFKHIQSIFGTNQVGSIKEVDVRRRSPSHAYPFPAQKVTNTNSIGHNKLLLSLASLRNATRLIEDESNRQLTEHLRSKTVTAIILVKDKHELLTRSIRSLLDRNDLPGIRVFAIVSNSRKRKANKIVSNMQLKYTGRLAILQIPSSEWNNSKAVNYAARLATSDYLLLHGSQIEIVSEWAISELVAYHYLYNADISGAKLLGSSGLVHHNGLAIAYSKTIAVTSPGKGYLEEQIRAIYPSQSVVHECSAVSDEFLLVGRDRFHYLGGLSPSLDQAFGDIDLCLRSRNCGGRTICVTEPTIIHADLTNKSKEPEHRDRVELNREFLVKAHADSFRSRDEFHYGEILDNSISVKPGNVDFVVNSGNLIEINEVLRHESIRYPIKDIATIFVHFDATGELREDVIFYLEKLKQESDIFFVSSSIGLCSNNKAIEQLRRLTHMIIVRTNSGYDFGSWSHVIQELGPRIFDNYEHLLLCNDSVIGPIHDLGPILDSFIRSQSDFCGLTASTAPAWHLQSYFILYKKSVFSDPLFKYMWSKIREHPTKYQLINAYEISFSSFLMQLGYNPYVHFDTHTSAGNNTHLKWKELVEDGYPFVKKELVRDNPLGVDIDRLCESISHFNIEAGEVAMEYCKRVGNKKSESENN